MASLYRYICSVKENRSILPSTGPRGVKQADLREELLYRLRTPQGMLLDAPSSAAAPSLRMPLEDAAPIFEESDGVDSVDELVERIQAAQST